MLIYYIKIYIYFSELYYNFSKTMSKLEIKTNTSFSKKKLLVVSHLFHPAVGGTEIHLLRLTTKLAQLGFKIKVLTTNAYSTEAFFLNDKRRIKKRFERINGIEIERLGFHTFGRRTLNFLRNIACYFRYPLNSWIRTYSYGPRNPQFLKKIREEKPDIILAAPFPTYNMYYAWKGAKELQIPLIIYAAFHLLDPCSFDNSLFYRIMQDASLIGAQTETERQYLINQGRIPAQKIEIFPPLPITEEDISQPLPSFSRTALRQKYGISQSKVLLCLSQHGRHKNILPVILAMEHVWKENEDIALVIAGRTTAYTSVLKNQAKILNSRFGRHIYFFDNFSLHQKEEIWGLADLFINLSEFESFGIVFVEAMHHGLPVIASTFGVAPSIITDFQTGALVSPKSLTEIAGAIIELIKDKKILNIYGENGRKKVLEEFNPRFILNKWKKRLQSILEKDN